MDSGERGKIHWSVFDGVKIIAATPEALMSEIDSAISNLEYSRATAFLEAKGIHDARTADESYRAGCAALAAGKLEEARRCFNVSLSKCPPDKTAAVAKLQSLISLTSQHLQSSSSSSSSSN
jgi:predicted TPR repeat methyltransferase